MMHIESDNVPLVSYQVIGDNVDFRQNPTHLSLSSVVRDHHYFTLYAVKNRVNGENLSNVQASAEVEKLPLSTWIPSVNDCLLLRTEFTVLTVRILVSKLKAFEEFADLFQSTYPTATPKKCLRNHTL